MIVGNGCGIVLLVEGNIGDVMLWFGAPDRFLGFVEVQLEVGPCLGVVIFVVPFPNVAGKYLHIGNGDDAHFNEFCRHSRRSPCFFHGVIFIDCLEEGAEVYLVVVTDTLDFGFLTSKDLNRDITVCLE